MQTSSARYLLPGSFYFSGGRRSQTNQSFNTLRAGLRSAPQRVPKLHDECNFRHSEVFPNDDGGHGGDGNKNIRLNIPGRSQAKDGFQHNGNAAQHNGYP